MELIKPPTDNLYKFLGIAGLLLCGFGLWLQTGYRHQIKLEQFEARERAITEPVTAEISKEKIEYLDKHYNGMRTFEILALILGASLGGWGIGGWLFRVQVLEDRILRQRALGQADQTTAQKS